MTTISIPIPPDLSERYADPQELKNLFWRSFVLVEYQRGNFSLREAAVWLGLSYQGFMDLLAQYHFSFINASKTEILQNYQQFSQFMNRRK